MKKILLLAVGLNFALLTFGQLINLEFEVFHVHDDTEYDEGGTLVNLDGYTTYRLFANLTNETDFVSSVSGDINDPLRVGAINDCGEDPVFWHHPAANITPLAPISDVLFSALPTLAYDSHVTLGWHYQSEFPGAQALSFVQDIDNQPWAQTFNAGNSFDINTEIGGVWFTTLGDASSYAFAGDDLRVCLGQFTSKCDIEFLGCVQVFIEGVQPTEGDGAICGAYACSTANCVPGCTDPVATNYNPAADTDDGSCIYDCALVIDSIQVTDVSCTGFSSGSLEIFVSGNQGEVLYSDDCGEAGIPNSSISGLSAGDYTICVTDSQGCNATETVTVSEPEPISVTLASVTFPSCNGFDDGGLCVNISGGTTGGTFLTSIENDSATAEEGNCVSGYEAGSNVIYVWENIECPAFISQGFTIAELGAPIANANTSEDASCANTADGEVTILGQGGVGPYTFTFSIGEDVTDTLTIASSTVVGDLFCGNYTVTMVDANGCPAEAVDNVVVACPAVVEVNGVDGGATDISCPGEMDGSISVTGAGGNGTFLYNIASTQELAEAGSFDNTTGSFEDLAAGPYWVAANSNGCVGSTLFEVGSPDPITYEFLTPDFAADENGECAICLDENSITGGTGTVTWFWEPGFVTDACLTGLDVGETATLTISDENDCQIIDEQVFECTVGLFELENNISINMFPNPTTGVININAEGLNGQKVSAVVTNALGAAVQAEDFGNLTGVWNKEINISDASDGIYFLTITVGQEEVTYRVVKN